LLADYIVAEVLDALPPRHREVALMLSVVTGFDADLCHRLAGPDANDVVADLERRRLVIAAAGCPRGSKRFHRLFRELLESELRWRDPRLHVDMHRAAATIWRERGNVNAAYRHLMAAGDPDAANNIVIEPVVQLVDRGDRLGLAMLADPFHDPYEVDQPGLALDVATTWIFAGSESEAESWCARASSLIDDAASVNGHAGVVRRRLHAVRCLLALYHGDADAAADGVREFEEHESSVAQSTPVERRFATVATRVALTRGDLDEARRWLVRSKTLDAPAMVPTVTVPALEAWFELLSGRLSHAIDLAEAACSAAEHAARRPHHDLFDAIVVAARAQFAVGDLGTAQKLAALARADAAELGFDWNRGRAGLLSAQVSGALDGPQAAIAIIRDVRLSLDRAAGAMHDALAIAEARQLGRLGHFGHAWTLIEHVGESAPVQLARAGLHLEGGRADEVGRVLDDGDAWLPSERLEGDVLRAAADATGAAATLMRAAVEDAAASGWVSPFLGHGPRVDGLLRQQPLDRLHPALFQHFLPHGKPLRYGPVDAEQLTARELTILALLPSHLSYSQIGRELHLSVNTVKSNLKSIYRKLAVTNRSDAVDIAREAHLI
jgi:LuxR family maltose regulon positive regulatory protein